MNQTRRGWRFLRPLLHAGSLVSGALHFYWWLIVPPLLMCAAAFAGFYLVPGMRDFWRSRPAQWAMGPKGFALAALTWALPTAVLFAVGWLLRLAFEAAGAELFP